MPDNFLHAQYADLLRRLGFHNDEANKRWINPNALHIVVNYREDEYSVYGYGALPRTFQLREPTKCETVINSLLVVNSSRDAFDTLYAWATSACEDLNSRFPHTEFIVNTNFKAEPVIWFCFKELEECEYMQVANCDNLREAIRISSLNKPKSQVVLDYMAGNGFYESLDALPAIEPNENTVTYYVRPERLQNCALIALDNVKLVERIVFSTQTEVTDSEGVSAGAISALVNAQERHVYIAVTHTH